MLTRRFVLALTPLLLEIGKNPIALLSHVSPDNPGCSFKQLTSVTVQAYTFMISSHSSNYLTIC